MTTCRQIGIDVREWRRGTSTGIARVITGFLSWATRNTSHQFVLCGNQRTEFRVRAETIRNRVQAETNRTWWDQVALPRLLADAEVDVFLSPYYKGPLRAPCPVVVTANDLIELRYPGSSWFKRRMLPTWMRIMLRRAARVLTLSDFSRRDLVDTFGLEHSRIGVVPVGIDERFFRKPPADLQREALDRLDLPAGYVLYVGRCAAHKNVRTLVRAWNALPEAVKLQHPLVLAGGDRDRFRALARAEGARARVPGFVDDADLVSLYRAASVMCFPSLYEGFGLPPLEAMACEVPVVSSNAASLPEVLGDAALLVGPLDEEGWTAALERTLQDDGTRTELVRRGRSRTRLYSQERAAAAMLTNLVEACEA